MSSREGPTPRMVGEQELNESDWDTQGISSQAECNVWICTTGRSGSWLLARQMLQAGLGVPHEYFNPRNLAQIRERVPEARSDAEYLAWIMKHRRTPNGVFAAKIHWNQFPRFEVPLRRSMRINDIYIHLRRRDALRQAISMYIARATGDWTGLPADRRLADEALAMELVSSKTAEDHARAIQVQLEMLVTADASWRLYFARRGLRPVTIEYEDLAADQLQFIERIARLVGVKIPEVMPESKPARLATSAGSGDLFAKQYQGYYQGQPVPAIAAINLPTKIARYLRMLEVDGPREAARQLGSTGARRLRSRLSSAHP